MRALRTMNLIKQQSFYESLNFDEHQRKTLSNPMFEERQKFNFNLFYTWTSCRSSTLSNPTIDEFVNFDESYIKTND